MSFAAIVRRTHSPWAALAALAGAASVYSALSTPLGADYPGPPQLGSDFAGPPIEALAGGHVAGFFTSQPFMGPVTLLLRAPFVALARALGAGELSQYRLGCLVCLGVAAPIVCWLAVACAGIPPLAAHPLRGHMRAGVRRATAAQPARWRACEPWVIAAVAVVVLLAGPLTGKALWWGHPEEFVGAVLCAAGVLMAGRGRVTLAGVALGLALATKQWALLALLPAVAAAPAGGRVRLMAIACGVAAVLLVPMFLGDPSRFIYQNLHAGLALSGSNLANVTPTNVWFALRTSTTVVISQTATSVDYQMPAFVSAISHPLAIGLGLATALALVPAARARARARARRAGGGDEAARGALLALALAFLLRCLLDPVTISYHHVPFLVVLCCFELMRPGGRGVPWLTVGSSAALWALGRWAAPSGDVTLFNQLYLMWGLPLAGYLTVRLLGVARAGAVPAPSTLAALPAAAG